jgi:chromosome segregation ATPase
MNLLGKIFVVLILVMSLVFASFAVAVYSAHRNWKDEAKKQQDLVATARAELEKETAIKEQLQADIEKEAVAKREALAKLETERDELSRQRDDLAKQRDDLAAKDKASVAALDSAQQNLAKLTSEVEALRGDIRTAQSDRDQHFKQVVELTDNVHQAQGELNRLGERNVQLSGVVAAQRKVLTAHDLSKDTPVDGIPPQVRGKVLAVNRNNLIETSLGSDDGLRSGHTLEVFRADKYLGRVEVINTTTDRAVAKILPAFRKAAIQEGDDVATRFKAN